MIALNETVIRLGLQKEMAREKEEAELLQKDLERYLQENI